MTESTVLQSLLGGVLIGVSALVLLAYNGRIAGVSGVIAGLFNRNRSSAGDKAWRLLFLIGLIIGAGAYYALSGISVPHREGFSHVALVIG